MHTKHRTALNALYVVSTVVALAAVIGSMVQIQAGRTSWPLTALALVAMFGAIIPVLALDQHADAGGED